MNSTSNDNIIDQNYYHLIDYCISNINDDNQTSMTKRELLSALCHLTYNIDLIVYMKSHSLLKSPLLKFSESDDSEISFIGYRILSVVLTEEDIKCLANVNKIVSLFNLYLISMIDDPLQKTALQSLLHSLKSN